MSEKPFIFAGPEPQHKIIREQREYDRFVADVDNGFASLYHGLESSGILEDTWLVLTSDHGELFERGLIGHTNIALFEPLLTVPLLIFPPGSSSRVDIHDRTSAVDVLPTLLHLTDLPPLPELPGHVLPPFNTAYNGLERQILAMNPKNSETTFQMREGTIAMLQEEFKMVYYFGHEEMGDVQEYLELYDLANDPEELENLVSKLPDRAEQMWNALEKKLTQAESGFPALK